MKLAAHMGKPGLERRRWLPPLPVFITLILLFLFVCLLAVSFGSVSIPILTIAQIILNETHLFHFAQTWDPSSETIIWQIRMPTVIGAALVGAALAVAGALFQGMLRNPLADPFLIGTSSGAALGATFAFVLPISITFFPLTPLLAFLGAMLTVLFVYALARTNGRTPVVTLLLAGVVMNAVLDALQTLVLTLWPSNNFGRFISLFNWLAGGVASEDWSSLTIIATIVLTAIVLSYLCASTLDVFALGEESASHLGLHVERAKFLIVILASLLTAAAVSISGLVGFVGLVTPHLVRLLLGPRHRILLPATALSGAIFLILADLLARTLVPQTVLPVGIFTALVGAPFFLALLRGGKREYTWQ
jgi:iron complex transport system permease protein